MSVMRLNRSSKKSKMDEVVEVLLPFFKLNQNVNITFSILFSPRKGTKKTKTFDAQVLNPVSLALQQRDQFLLILNHVL